MNVLVVLGHPEPGSFNHAIAAAAVRALERSGHAVALHDLWAERFDPVLPPGEAARDAALHPALRRHCDDLARADGIVVVHPNWWGQPPAILKGWIDRVVRPGVAYAFEDGDGGEGVPVGLLRARTAVVLNTSNTPERREREAFGDPLEAIWKRCVFDLCGVADVRRRTFGVIVTSTPEQRRAWLAEVEELVVGAFPPHGRPAPPAPPRAAVACRPARPGDADAIARIYNQGIADRSATFETRPRSAAEVAAWLASPLVVAEEAGAVLGWAALSATSARACYAGVLELSIYVERAARGRGAGRALGEAILAAAAAAGAWKVLGKLFTDNAGSASLVRALGFREVGVHRRHARLDGAWRDVLVVEKLLGEAAGPG